MLLRFITKYDLLSLLLIPLAGVLLWYRSFQAPPSMEGFTTDGVMPLYAIIRDLLKDQSFWLVLIGFILVVINSFLITRICFSFGLFKKGFRLPGIIYFLVVSSWKVLLTLHPVHFATLCILITIFYIFNTYQKELDISFTFNASFFLGLASMFYLPSAILLPLVLISIFILQKSDNWRLVFVPFFGFIVPWLFLLSIAFMNDTLGALFSTLNGIIWANNSDYLFNPVFLTISAFMGLLMLLGSVSFLTSYPYLKVSTRKFFVVFYWMLFIIGISTLSFSTIGIEVIALVTIPSAFLVSIFFLSGEKMFWKEIILLLFFLLLIFNNLSKNSFF